VRNRYRAAFEPPGSLFFSLSGLLARLPVAMIGLALVLVLSADGNYTRAGTLVGVLALASCVGGPAQGRVADRFGQARILLLTAAAFGLSLTAMILTLHAHGSFGLLIVLAAVVGAASPTTGTLARSRWSGLHPAGDRLQTAFAVESVFDEVVFVTGPVLTTVLATQVNALLPLVIAVVTGVAGSVLMALARTTEPHRDPVSGPGGAPAAARPKVGWAGLAPLLLVQLTVGSIFGGIDVVTVAAASAAGERGTSGLILACFSGGSLVAGVVVGAMRWRMSPMRRVRVCVSLLGLATLLLPFVPNVRLLPIAGFLVGVTVSPSLVALAAAVQARTQAARFTEAMAVSTAFLVAGFSLGSASAGHLVDAVGPHRAFWQVPAAGLAAATVVLLPPVLRRIRRLTRDHDAAAPEQHASEPTGAEPTGAEPSRELSRLGS